MNICGTCGKSFARSHTMQIHMEMVHEGIKNHQCKICKQKFTTKQCLVRHQDNFEGKCRDKAKRERRQ